MPTPLHGIVHLLHSATGMVRTMTTADLTTDPNDPRLGRGIDKEPVEQNAAYLILSEAERAKGFIRPYRDAYRHVDGCNTVTTMARELSETYARDPKFYGSTYCVHCRKHLPVSEFVWLADGQRVGS